MQVTTTGATGASGGGEIKVGDCLLDYGNTITSIRTDLIDALTAAQACTDLLSETTTYEGDATEEMDLFFASLNSHIIKLISLYQAAQTYLYNTYTESYYNEQQLVDWTIKNMGEES